MTFFSVLQLYLCTKKRNMKNKKKKLGEKRVTDCQQKVWQAYQHLYIIRAGSVWKAYNESAYVISALSHFTLSRKRRKTGNVDYVAFPKASLKHILSLINNSSGKVLRRIGRVIVYSWNSQIPQPKEFSLVKGKDIRFNLKLDEKTNSELERITSKGGFGGREKATKAEVIRYAILHFYDNKPVNLMEAEPLIKAISNNRRGLSSCQETLAGLVRELNAIGVNINQIAHKINFLMVKAAEEGLDLPNQIELLNSFWEEVVGAAKNLYGVIKKIEPAITPAKDAVLSALKGENEIMNRLLI